jgi:LAO/AO transport system kinase
MSAGPAFDPKSIRRLSRAISTVENQSAGQEEILAEVYRAPLTARVIGVTGPPGAGKSTLIDALTAFWAKAGEPVAVLAVDPSSPFSGGAVLGDRIRMDRSADLQGVYFRSVSARGQGGGLSAAVCDILAVLNHAGFRRVLLETVGAGQSDTAVAESSECTVVVNVPGLGDHVQASKAGLMEVGDVYVVNKADRPAASSTASQIDGALAVAYAGEAGINVVTDVLRAHAPQQTSSLGRLALLRRHGDPAREPSVWRPPVHLVSAQDASGVPQLAASIDAFLGWCEASERLTARRRARIRAQLARTLGAALLQPYVDGEGAEAKALDAWVEQVLDGKASPGEAVGRLTSNDQPRDFLPLRVPRITEG